jgi:hypothetical protein
VKELSEFTDVTFGIGCAKRRADFPGIDANVPLFCEGDISQHQRMRHRDGSILWFEFIVDPALNLVAAIAALHGSDSALIQRSRSKRVAGIVPSACIAPLLFSRNS